MTRSCEKKILIRSVNQTPSRENVALFSLRFTCNLSLVLTLKCLVIIVHISEISLIVCVYHRHFIVHRHYKVNPERSTLYYVTSISLDSRGIQHS